MEIGTGYEANVDPLPVHPTSSVYCPCFIIGTPQGVIGTPQGVIGTPQGVNGPARHYLVETGKTSQADPRASSNEAPHLV